MSDNPNTGHGHVRQRPDGVKARCGGPAMCKVCQAERAALEAVPVAAAAQPAPAPNVEPVAWRIKQGARVFIVSAAEFTRTSYDYGEFTPLYATPQPAPAAVPAGWKLVPEEPTPGNAGGLL